MSTELPWDRFEPEVPQQLPLPRPSPADSPVVVWHDNPQTAALTDVNLQTLAKDLLDAAMQYAQSTTQAIRRGEQVDHANPTITATTAAGRELVVADAKSRSKRTFIQGLIFDLFAGLVAVIATLSGADPFVKETWLAFGVLLLKTFVSAAISYVMRLKVTPTIRERGEKMALMPIPRPMIDDERKRT